MITAKFRIRRVEGDPFRDGLSFGVELDNGIRVDKALDQRMEGTGRRWSINGAEATLLLRSVYTSDDWDDYWIAHMKRERKLLNQRSFDGLGYPDDYSFWNWQCEEMTGT
ncbi:hypothetical protein DSCOOX_54210 [Desulfosarcina ovata subsp. ovata]|uniref:Uncharacterized protein n=1 Tax=Desulfosarcina ovata subsp. ovata TaxID=2752305 RepID=A0A5K8AHX7_9BACT|nr:hypothetical protein [Desulfosarcina ovata]BBO92241.1 hypothetical protein DSCOOX_54210 [Desulfosarcina ovata subsp. ovata]